MIEEGFIHRLFFEKKKLSEFVRFCIVGALSASIDAIVFYTFSTFTVYQVAVLLGYFTGLLFNYIFTIYWTFGKKPSAKNAFGVVSAHLINLFIIRMGLMWLFVSIFDMSDKIAYLPTIVISVIANFLMVKFAVSKTSK